MKTTGSNFSVLVLKILAVAVIAFSFFAPIYSVQHIKHMHSHMMPVSGCAYVASQSAICDMRLFDGFREWQNTLINTLSQFKYLALLTFCIIVSLSLYFSPTILASVFYLRRQKYIPFQDLNQELFSQGILNSKAF